MTGKDSTGRQIYRAKSFSKELRYPTPVGGLLRRILCNDYNICHSNINTRATEGSQRNDCYIGIYSP